MALPFTIPPGLGRDVRYVTVRSGLGAAVGFGVAVGVGFDVGAAVGVPVGVGFDELIDRLFPWSVMVMFWPFMLRVNVELVKVMFSTAWLLV